MIEIKKYIARKVIEDIENGIILSENLSEQLYKYDYVDYLRNEVHEKHIEILLQAIKNNLGTRFGELCVTCIQKYGTSKLVQDSLFNLLKDGTKTFDERHALIWRIIENKDLDVSIHNELYNLILINIESFKRRIVTYSNGKENVISVCRERIKDKRFPIFKHWIYFVTSLASDDKGEILKFLKENLDTTNSFNKKVVEELIKLVSNDL